jgi:glycosyltransferase involved in cell wall biosynthesis
MNSILVLSPSVYQDYGHTFDYVSGLAKAAVALGGLDIHVLGFDGPFALRMPPHDTPHTRALASFDHAKGDTPLKQIKWGLQRISQGRRMAQFAVDLSHRLNCAGVLFESFEYYRLGRQIARFNRPLRCVFHDTSFDTHQTSVPAALYKKAMAHSAARIVGYCERTFVHGVAMRENLIHSLRLGSRPASRITAIPYGTPTPSEFRHMERSEAQRTLGIAGDGPLLLAFGTLRKDKKFPLLLEALALAPNWRLLIAGPEGDMTFEEIETAVLKLGISDRVCCRNRFISSDEQPLFFGAADAVAGIYSSAVRHESGTCQLARAFLRPIIASGPPDLTAYVQSTGVGWAVPHGTPQALANILSTAETESEDDRRAMRDRIEQCAIERSWSCVCAEVFRGWC